VLRDFLSRKVSEDFDAQRAAIVTQAMAEETGPAPEPIPLPVAPPRRRMPTGPWLMAALFFAAAALVLAVLIWLRPIPQ
jgi:ferric-dicitrate binding protein FerR (iron transport regulator)